MRENPIPSPRASASSTRPERVALPTPAIYARANAGSTAQSTGPLVNSEGESMPIVYAAIACGLIAVVYGFITSRQVMSASPGNERMQDIAAAIQEGARAYLGRQY